MKKSLFYILLLLPVAVFAQLNKQNPQIDKIDILHYRFELKLSDTSDILIARTTVTLNNLEKNPWFYLHLVSGENGMTVTDVSSGNKTLQFRHIQDKLYIENKKWNSRDTVEIVISYHGIPSDGLIISKNKYGEKTFFGDNWPDRARNWLAVLDHPSDKATVEFIIEVPELFEVVASGELIDVKQMDKMYKKHHYRSKIALPTKVMVIGVADFKSKKYGDINSVPVSAMVFENAPDAGLDDYGFSMDAFRFFANLIGEYPFEKLVNVQSKTIYGGMENAGNIFYFENSVDGGKNYEDLIAHEIAHQWFGNSVTEKDWHHVWLSEGFATYLTSLYIGHKYGIGAMKKRMAEEKQTVIAYNRYYPGSVIDTSITNWDKLLNPYTYQKAAWVLHMLRVRIGENDFNTILRTFYSRYRNKNADTGDLLAVVNEITNTDHSVFFRQWLYENTIPDLRLKWKIKNEIIYLEVLQKNQVFSLDLPVKLSTGETNETFILKIRKKNETFAFPLQRIKTSDNVLILVDPDVTVLQECKIENLNETSGLIPLIEGIELLREGDLIFQDLDCGPLCEAIETVTEGYRNAHFSHVGILINDENNQIKVLEAIGEKVKLTPLNDFLNRYFDTNGRPKVVVGRLEHNAFDFKNLKNIDMYLEKTYDDVFDITDDRYYCSELVYLLYSDYSGKKLFELVPMTFKDKESGKFFPAWQKYYDTINIKIPEGKPGINPGGISKSDKIEIIYRYGDPEGWE